MKFDFREVTFFNLDRGLSLIPMRMSIFFGHVSYQELRRLGHYQNEKELEMHSF